MDRWRKNWGYTRTASTANTAWFQEEPESSLSSEEASGHEFEVFLSFMGQDTRKKIIDHLYYRMMDAGISVFKDNVNLPDGKEIAHSLSEAIKKSKIAMPILSTNYAASRWCLDELVCMLGSRKTRKQTVLPIFYDVTPSQVRHQTGSYDTAFEEHAKKYEEEKIEKWRTALAEVSLLKGLELEKETAGHEGQLTKLIVAKVLSALKKSHLLVPENLVGTDNMAKAIMCLLNMSSKDVRMVGIWGIGGIGKTTLAKFIYNQILDEFEFCSFLKDIREASLKHSGLEGLQTQLVSDLSREAHQNNFTSIDEGINKLKHRVREKKVLILLDDVDHVRQLNALAKEITWFGPGSRIVITTRNRDVLHVHQVSRVYEVKEMDQEDALRLFCRHAFRKDTPTHEFKALSYDVVKTTGGLPLALEVIGSFLSQKGKPIWEETLQKLKRAPKEEVQKRLKISYDSLDDDKKKMFLDVACHFIGQDIHAVTHVWKDRNFSAEIGTYVLLGMSLLEIGEDDKIWMHDQLRDLGREIFRQENYREPGKRSRLWHEDEARAALEKQVIKSDVEALHLRFDSRQDICIKSEQLMNFPNIWYLYLYDVDLVGDFQHLLPNLRWLTWKCTSEVYPSNLNLEKLLVLDLSYSSIEDADRRFWSSIQGAKKLKVLNLTSCMGLSSILDVSMFINLERLILDNCLWLEKISTGKLENLLLLSMKNCRFIEELSIGSLTNLERLSLENCRSIQRLPDSIGKLKSLIELDLSKTSFPNLPSSICDLDNLQVLKIFNSRICSFPNAILHFEKLHIIDNFVCESFMGNISKVQWTIGVSTYIKMIMSLHGSESLHELKFSGGRGYQHLHLNTQQLPEGLKRVEALQLLRVIGCGSFEKLPIPSNLKFLVRLEFFGCDKLQQVEVLDELEALQELNIIGCVEIMKLPYLSKLKSLEILNISSCLNLEELEGLDLLEALLELKIKSCGAIKKLSSLSKLKSLRVLICCGCDKLQEIEGLDGLEALERFSLKECTTIERLPSLSGLRSLRILNCHGCEKLQEIEELNGLEALEEFNLEGCRSIEKLPSLSSLQSLRILNYFGCENLNELNLEGCRAIEKLPRLSSLKSLRILNCCGCEKLQEIEGLDGLGALEEFNLEGCSAIEKLPSLYNLRSLRILKYYGCEKLQKFSLIGCIAIEKLSSLSSLRSLKVLICRGCDKLREIEELDGLEALEEFNLEECRAIEKLPSLSDLHTLRILTFGCEKLQGIEGLDQLETVEEFYLKKCRALEKLPSLSDLRSLRILDCRGCEKLQEIEGLDGLKALEELNLEECRALEKLPSLSNLRSLRVLNCCGCEKVQKNEGLDGLEALKELNLEGCRAIEKLPSLSGLRSLTILICTGCEKLQEIEGLDGLEALKEFTLEECRAIEKLPSLSSLRSLRILNCCGCERLHDIEGLDRLEMLEELYLRKCKEIEKLPSLSNLRSLRVLNCCGCEKVQEIEGLDGLAALEEFNLEECRAIEKLPSVSDLLSLRILNCCGCEKLLEIESLDRLRVLEDIKISRCKAIRHIPVLPKGMKIARQWLDLTGCDTYEKIHRIQYCSICQLTASDLCWIACGGRDDKRSQRDKGFRKIMEPNDRYSLDTSDSLAELGRCSESPRKGTPRCCWY